MAAGRTGSLPESAKELPSSSVEAIAKKGVVLGRNVLSTISLLWSVARLPLRKISYALETLHGLRLSPATIGHTLQNASGRLARFQEGVRRRVNMTKRANFDETGVSVAGRKGWIWVAATDTVAFIQVAMSRGGMSSRGTSRDSGVLRLLTAGSPTGSSGSFRGAGATS